MDSPTSHELKLPAGLASAHQLEWEAFASAIKPDPELWIDEWADQYRILSPESSKEHGQWRTDRAPHGRDIMRALSPMHPCQEVTFAAGTQVQKTEIGNNFIGYVIHVCPAPMMMVQATSGTGKRTSKTRLAKMIEAMPCLRERISDKARDGDNSQSLKMFPGGILVIAGSNSAAELKSQPVRFLFEDEVDEYPDDVDGQGPADKLAEARTDTYESNKKIYRASTPTRRSGKIWKHYQNSNMQRRHVPCPHCEQLFVLKWEGFRYETRKIWQVIRADDGEVVEVPAGTEGATARDTGEVLEVWYECPHCAGRIAERWKPWMFDSSRAKWIAERPDITRHQGFHLPSYYSPLGWFPWHKIVEERLLADKDPTKALLRAWFNTRAAEPYDDDGGKVSDLELRRRAPEAAKPYQKGVVPMFAWLLTAGVDVQADRLEVNVKGWGREKESCLVDYEVIHGDTETRAPWAALDDYRKKKFRHECGAQLRIEAVAVDAGFRTQTVYDWVRTRMHEHVIAVRGQSQAGKTILGKPTPQDIDHNGVKIPNGVMLWPIGTDTAKTEIYARLRIELPGPGHMHFPLGLPNEYYRGLTSERLASKFVRGYLKTSWEKDATERNEPLDLEVYAYAAALYAGLNRWNWDRYEAAMRMTASDLFVQAQVQATKEHDAPEAELEGAHAPAADAAEPMQAAVQTSVPASRPGWVPRRPDWLRRR